MPTKIAASRPRFDHDHGELFDGKVGMWPFVQSVLAVRNSRNRPAGTMVTFLVNSVMRLILEHDGGNHYVLPHLTVKEAALRHTGLLMQNVSCPVSLLLYART
ncbi:hypothetical protein H257_18658 [Aphanomyces astaci]|uniref:Uncharacterized protein n=1 Tax=Aphanomyces astaci TaxID=112090 RepID=W4FAH8_APHAT|nr:hypothetical protein H257_18658 [Aphanomyces astaci]ETV64462.1 hypothetical protein H257_18658 [Aphanomyces astaci]|eukprot:XP_009846054.1 hypothetical protein H257_18658 [Aphanomyces astaci]